MLERRASQILTFWQLKLVDYALTSDSFMIVSDDTITKEKYCTGSTPGALWMPVGSASNGGYCMALWKHANTVSLFRARELRAKTSW